MKRRNFFQKTAIGSLILATPLSLLAKNKTEFEKCKEDIGYFIKKYCAPEGCILTMPNLPTKRIGQNGTYMFYCRQHSRHFLGACFSLHRAIFMKERVVHVIDNKSKNSTLIKDIYYSLPKEFQTLSDTNSPLDEVVVATESSLERWVILHYVNGEEYPWFDAIVVSDGVPRHKTELKKFTLKKKTPVIVFYERMERKF